MDRAKKNHRENGRAEKEVPRERKRIATDFLLPGGATLPLSVPLPDHATRPWWPFVKIRGKGRFAGLIVQDHLLSMYIHTEVGKGKRPKTQPCWKSANLPCEHCGVWDRRYVGYLAVMTSDKPLQPQLLCLTLGACHDHVLLHDDKPFLAGRGIVLQRGEGDTGWLSVINLDAEPVQVIPLDQLIKRTETLNQLMHIWKVRQRPLGPG